MSVPRAVVHSAAGAHIGLGHLVRSLAIAEAAAGAGWDVVLSADVPAGVGRRLVDAAAARAVPAPHDGRDLVRLAVRESASLIHVDTYDDLSELHELCSSHGIVLSSIEDGPFGRRRADVSIDPGLGADDRPRPADGTPVLLRGARFAPLRPSVRRATVPPTTRAGRERTALVVMGGTDAADALVRVARAVARAAETAGGWTVLVIDPRAGSRKLADELHGAAGAELVTSSAPVDHLPELAAASDLVITAAGTSVWELACLRRAMALLQVADNQREGYEAVVDAGAAVGLGVLGELDEATAADRLRQVMDEPDTRRGLASRAGQLVDGLGAERIVSSWGVVTIGAPLRLRRAEAADGDLLLRWRNDDATRRWSRSTDVVPRADHLRWLESSLARQDRLLLVAEEDSVPVATVRFDRASVPTRWEVSITVSPEARGGGLGGRVLRRAVQSIGAFVDDVDEVLAFVRPENDASVRLFTRSGFERTPKLDEPDFSAFILTRGHVDPGPTDRPVPAGSLGGVPARHARGAS